MAKEDKDNSQQKPYKHVDVCRPGKTKRDRANNSHGRNASNKEQRASWQNDSKATNASNSFPYGTCNGKRNRALKERTSKG